MSEPKIETDLLLAQSGWLRRLARQLVLDPGRADDAVQETFVAALEAPPRGAGSVPVLRAWLATVLRSRVRGARIRRSNRTWRERVVAQDESAGDAAVDALVGRAESSQMLVEEMQRLPESHRAILLLKYFEGLSAAQIAQQLELGESGVRTRLMRARDALREQLDRRHRGVRGDWLAALAPMAGLAPRSAAAVSASAHAFLGATAMLKISVLACLAVIAALFLRSELNRSPQLEPQAVSRAHDDPAPDRTAAAVDPVGPRMPVTESTAPDAPRPKHVALGQDGLFRPLLRGRVTGREGRPVVGATVTGTWGPHGTDGGPSTKAQSDSDGYYALTMPARAPVSMHSGRDGGTNHLATIKLIATCTAEGFRAVGTSMPYPVEEPAEVQHRFELTPTVDLRGVCLRVLDPEGHPVHGAGVALFDPQTGRVFEDEEGRLVWLVTGLDGWAYSEWRPAVPTIPFAITKAGLAGRGDVLMPSDQTLVEVVVSTLADVDLSGLLVDAAGTPQPDRRVELVCSDDVPEAEDWGLLRLSHSLYETERPWAGFGERGCRIRTGPDGRFQVGHLVPGTYWARLEDDTIHGPFAVGSDVVLRLGRLYCVKVRAVDHQGLALRGSGIVASNESSTRSGGLPDRMQYVRIPLAAGRWRITAHLGDAASAWRDIDVPRDVATPLDLALDFSTDPAPVTIRVVGPDGANTPAKITTTRALPPGAERAAMGGERAVEHVGDGGVFPMELRPGTYEVRVLPEGENLLPMLAKIDVEEGGSELVIEVLQGGRVVVCWSNGSSVSEGASRRVALSVRRTGSEDRWTTTTRGGGALAEDGFVRLVGTRGQLEPGNDTRQPGPLLPPGTWDVRVTVDDQVLVERTVTIAPGVEFELPATAR